MALSSKRFRTALIFMAQIQKGAETFLMDVDVTASHSCRRFVGCTMMQISCFQSWAVGLISGAEKGRFPNSHSSLFKPDHHFPYCFWSAHVKCKFLSYFFIVVFCCCSPFALRFKVLWGRRCYSAYLDCKKWLSRLLLPSYLFEALTSGINGNVCMHKCIELLWYK